MREAESTLAALSIDVAIVAFDSEPMARAYIEDTGTPWPVLLDHDRALYRAYDMDRAPLWDVWGPRALLRYARLLLGGRRLERAGEDTRQRGGDVLIDPDGVVRFHVVGRGPADRPSPEALIERVRGHCA